MVVCVLLTGVYVKNMTGWHPWNRMIMQVVRDALMLKWS